MSHPLQSAYFEKYCNACGGTYRVTLYEILQEKRLRHEWQSPRHCASCAADRELYLVDRMPTDALEKLDEAWREIEKAARDAELDLHVETLR